MDEKRGFENQTEELQPNDVRNYEASNGSTIASIDRPKYGHQDTYGEAEANQVSVAG